MKDSDQLESGSEVIPFLPASCPLNVSMRSKNRRSFWVTVYGKNLDSSMWPVNTDGSRKTTLLLQGESLPQGPGLALRASAT